MIMDDAERRSPYPKPLSQCTAELAPAQRLLPTSTPPSPSPLNTQKRPLPQNFQLLPPRQRGSPALPGLNKPRGRAGELRPGRGLFPFQPEQAATPVSPEKPGTVCFHFSPRQSGTATPVTGAGRPGPLRPRTRPPPPRCQREPAPVLGSEGLLTRSAPSPPRRFPPRSEGSRRRPAPPAAPAARPSDEARKGPRKPADGVSDSAPPRPFAGNSPKVRRCLKLFSEGMAAAARPQARRQLCAAAADNSECRRPPPAAATGDSAVS